MYFKPSDAINLNNPDFVLNSEPISIVDEYKYLGYIICDNLSNEKDIDRQKRNIYAQGNTLIRNTSLSLLRKLIFWYFSWDLLLRCTTWGTRLSRARVVPCQIIQTLKPLRLRFSLNFPQLLVS